MKRSTVLTGIAGLLLAAPAAARAATAVVTHTDAEWRKLLPPESYEVLRHEGTERAFSSPLDEEKRSGTYFCLGCDLALFSSKTWPRWPAQRAQCTSVRAMNIELSVRVATALGSGA